MLHFIPVVLWQFLLFYLLNILLVFTLRLWQNRFWNDHANEALELKGMKQPTICIPADHILFVAAVVLFETFTANHDGSEII